MKRITDELINECYLYCYKRINDKNDAEDLSQTILLEIVKYIRSGKEINSFYGFFWKVAENQIKIYLHQKEKKAVLVSYDFIDSYENGIEPTIDDNTMDKMRKAITRISSIHRTVIIDYYLKNLSIRDIAKELNISESAVKKRLFDAKDKIKKEINKMDKTIIYDIPRVELWGGWNWCNYDKTVETRIRRSILVICKSKPLTINEIAMLLDINPLYIEDEINNLVVDKFLIKEKDKYQTNIILYKKSSYQEFKNMSSEIYSKLATDLNDILDKNKDKINQMFITSYDYDELKWVLFPRMCDIFSNECLKKYQKENQKIPPKIERDYYAEGCYETSSDRRNDLIHNSITWSNMHHNYVTKNNKKIVVSNLFDCEPFLIGRCERINTSNIDIIDDLISDKKIDPSPKDELMIAEMIKNNIIVEGKLNISYIKAVDFYKTLYDYVIYDLLTLVNKYYDQVITIINNYLLPNVEKHLLGDFYHVGIIVGFNSINVVGKVAIDNGWVKMPNVPEKSWYGVTIVVE